ncbi:MAG: GNAT family N-acetyltransferase [Dehalococcoidia bacterium]|nr:GNAT family N-acetyltransferase [Dehalococcoidia bacterium]
MNERRQLEAEDTAFALKNTPLRPRERRALLEAPGTFHVGSDDGEVFLADVEGQQALFWSFRDVESMRQQFPDMWQEAREHIRRDEVDHVTTDVSGLPTREWLEPLLRDADFEFFAEWMEMSNPDLDADAVPEFPDSLTMRKATEDDLERMYEIWSAAYGDYGDGPASFDWLTEQAGWAGALEDEDGELIAFAFNSPVERAEGRVLAAAVAPEAWGNGYGRLILAAAVYQLAASDAVRATIRVRPDIKPALRTCADLGFKYARAGLEYRRPVDEEAIAQKWEERRVAGVKARFGKWR